MAFTVANTSYKKKQNLCVCLNNKGHIHIAFQLFRNILIEVELLTNCKAVSILEANKILPSNFPLGQAYCKLSELSHAVIDNHVHCLYKTATHAE